MTAVREAPPAAAVSLGDLQATVSRDDLLQALNWVSYAINRRPHPAGMAGARFTAQAGGLTVAGFDYDCRATQTILALGSSGTALVPCDRLKLLVRTLAKGVEVKLRVDDAFLTVVAASPAGLSSFHLPLLPPDLPVDLAVLDGDRTSLSGAALFRLARATLAAGKDGTLPVLTGALLHPADQGVTAVCTDRYRLVRATAPIDWSLGHVLVPAASLRRAAAAFAQQPVDLALSADREWFGLSAQGRHLQVRLLTGEFLKYQSLIPEAAPSFTADRDGLAAAVLQAAAVGMRLAPVRLEAADGLTVHGGSSGPDSARAAIQVAGATVNAPVTMAFNSNYLLEGLHALPAGSVQVNATGPLRPIVLTSDELPDFLYLLMPVRMPS